MTKGKFHEHTKMLMAEVTRTWDAKCGSYTNESADVLSNFRRLGEWLGMPPQRVAAIYLMKQIGSLCTILAGGPDGGEPLRSRVVDAINYLRVIDALHTENENG